MLAQGIEQSDAGFDFQRLGSPVDLKVREGSIVHGRLCSNA